jgi:hypothetical protein
MAYIGNKPAELAVDIDNASVTTEKLANDAVTAAKIVDGTIIADDLNNGIITNSKVASNAAIAATKLAVSGGSNITLQSDGTFDLDASVDVTGGYSVGGTAVISSSRAGTLTGLSLTGNITKASGDLTLDVAGDIILDADGADFRYKDAGIEFLRINNGATGAVLLSPVSNKDIIFKGNDDGTEFVALTLDMSEAGAATFNSSITATGLTVDNGSSGQSKITVSEGGADNRNLVLYSAASGASAKIAVEGTTADLDFVVNNGSQTAMTIDGATGNVGVGVTSVDEKLHVNGSLLVDAFNAGHEEGIFFRDGFSNTNKYNMSILAYDHGSADAGQSTTSPDGLSINGYDGISFNVGSNNRNEVMRIKGGTANVGNVGIGIQNPPKALTVFRANQTDDTTVALLKLHAQFADSGIEQNDKVAIQFAVQNSGGGIQTSDAIKFSYNNNLYLMEDGGDVAIGNVSDPSARLDISAASSTAFGAQALKVRDGSHTTIQMDSGAADGRIQVGAAGTLRGVYKAQHAGTQTDHPFSLIQDNSSRLTIRDDRSVAHIDSGYRFDLGFFPAPSNTYQHFKTDVEKANHMVLFEYKGYSYSSEGAVLTAMTVYTYTGASGPYDPRYTRYGHNTANGFVNSYYSSDGYLVIVLKTNHTNGYTGGWMWAQSGNSFTDSNIRMLAQTSTSSNSGAY